MISIASIDYSKLKKEYLMGNISYRELAKKHGVPFGTLRKVAAKEQWTQLRTQARTKADTKIIEAISDKEAENTIDLLEVADLLAKKVREIAMTISDPDSIKKLTSAIKDLKDIKGIKSDADMREQEARIRKLEIESAFREEDEDKPSGVVLMPAITEDIKPPVEEDGNG